MFNIGKKVKRYTKEFKDTIVELYNNGKSYSELNSEYGVPKTTMLQWIKKDKSIKDGSFVANKKETENLRLCQVYVGTFPSQIYPSRFNLYF